MSTESVGEIIELLGFGSRSPSTGHVRQHSTTEESPVETGSYRLLRAGNDSGAEWIELHGAEPVFRVTRTKSKLLCELAGVIERWAGGLPPSSEQSGCLFRQVGPAAASRLEIRHKDWRPIRICQQQARGLVLHMDSIRRFADGE